MGGERPSATLDELREIITGLARGTAIGFEEMGRRFERVEARLDKVEQTVKESWTDMREFRIDLLGTRRKVAEHHEEIDLLKARAGAAG